MDTFFQNIRCLFVLAEHFDSVGPWSGVAHMQFLNKAEWDETYPPSLLSLGNKSTETKKAAGLTALKTFKTGCVVRMTSMTAW